MATTLMFEPITHFRCSFPLEQTQSLYGKSYYKFYQLKLRQVYTENQHRQEHSKQKQLKIHLNEKRSSKEYMNNIRDKMKIQSQNNDYGKRASSVMSITKRRTKDAVMFTIATATNATELRPKSILKTKQSSSSTNYQRVTSAPANSQKNIAKKISMKIPTIEIDDTDDDDDLPKSNSYSYTQVSSSSDKPIPNNHQYARQEILNTLMLHFNSYPPSDISKWSLLRDFDEKFSSSVSARVYRNFERIIL